MSSTFAKITAIGNLGRDPEMRNANNGTEVTSFSIACTRSWMAGETKKEETTWLRITTWGKLAVNCNNCLKKGSKVYIEGRLIPGENGGPKIFTKQDNTSGASFEVNASEVLFLTPKAGGGEDGTSMSGETEDEIPF